MTNDKPDFSEVTSDEQDMEDRSSSSSSRTEAAQVHIKGQYGTTTIRNTDGCHVCGRNADVVVLTSCREYGRGYMWMDEIHACDDHVSDVLGDLTMEQTPYETVSF